MLDAPVHTTPRLRRLGTWLREPIVHFLAIGGLLFGAFQIAHGSSGNAGNTIRVDREALLTFMQYRSNAFEFELFNKQLDDLTPAQRQMLVDAYVREEVMYREALAMGLQQGDYVIRQRMVQKMAFLLDGAVGEAIAPTRADLEAFYRAHAADYSEPTVYTFTHVFFDRERRGDAAARIEADRTLATLNRDHVPFSGAAGVGDRPLFFQNYVERTRDFVESHLGRDLTVALDDAETTASSWIGPIRSQYGWHLVLLTERRAARVPPLDELLDRVRDDYRRVELDRGRRASIDRLVGEYSVHVAGVDTSATAQ